MNTLRSSIFIAFITAAVGTGVHEARQTSVARNEAAILTRQNAQSTALAATLQQLQLERDLATNRLAVLKRDISNIQGEAAELLKLREEKARLQNARPASDGSPNNSIDDLVKSWVDKVQLLKNYFAQNPDATVPEFEFLTGREWLTSISPSAPYWPLNTGEDYQKAVQGLRNQAEMKFWGKLNDALRKFAADNQAQLPTSIAELQPYCDPAAATVLAGGYEFVPAGEVPANILPRSGQIEGAWVIARKTGITPNGGRITVVPMKEGRTINFHMTYLSPR